LAASSKRIGFGCRRSDTNQVALCIDAIRIDNGFAVVSASWRFPGSVFDESKIILVKREKFLELGVDSVKDDA